MESKRHEGKSLQYLTIEPDGYNSERDYPMVVLLHGFGANMDDLAGLCPAIDREGYLYACPNAPMSFQIGIGITGYGWTPPRGHGTVEDARRSSEMLNTFFDEVMKQYNVAPGRVILGGFSQGGGMTYRCGLGKPDVFAGLAALSSTMPGAEELKPILPEQRTQPIFIAHGIYDELAPVAVGREAKAFLEDAGYQPQYKEYPIRHEISQEVLDDLIAWVKMTLPPATV